MQNGSLMRSGRRRGPDVWEYRWREPDPDGRRKHRRIVFGSVIQLKDEDAAMRATCALSWDINLATLAVKESPSLSRSWQFTTLSVSLPPVIDGRHIPSSWGIEATYASESSRDGAATH